MPGGMRLHNKKPKWDDELNSWTLSFHGRVTEASNKNFIVEYDGPRACWDSAHDDSVQAASVSLRLPPSKEALLFGRTDEDTFSLDFKQPFCALQAFGVALTATTFKIGVE